MSLTFRIIRILGVLTGLYFICFFDVTAYQLCHAISIYGDPLHYMHSLIVWMAIPYLILGLSLIAPFREIRSIYLWYLGFIALALASAYVLLNTFRVVWFRMFYFTQPIPFSYAAIFIFVIFLLSQITVIFLQRHIDYKSPHSPCL
ncbi:MAG: hypothetical protein ABI443_11120 [Chthoniobacterales bacterium]